jgi:paraquat-inducible protein B
VKTKLSPFLIGTFVLGALMLAVVALLSFRSLHIFSTPGRFVAYFNESVQGLDVGSSVKLRGVRVGRVATIQVHYDSRTQKSQVMVMAELDATSISDRAGQAIQLAERPAFQRLIDEGLRARIDLVGITGLQFVELDFFDLKEFPVPHRDGESEYPVVPTLRSGMSELTANFSKIVSNLNKVDFAGLSRELQSLVATVNRQLSEVDLKQLVAKVTAAAASIEGVAGSADAKATLAKLSMTATDVQRFVGRLDAQVEPVQAELVRTLHSFHDAAQSVHKVFGPQSGLGEEAARTLQQVTETAESLQRLADFLERNPSALITGKKRPAGAP